MTHPLQIVARHLFILRHEECVDVTIQPDVQIYHSTIHVHKYEISIEQTCIEDCQEQKYEQLQDDAHITIAVSPVIVIVHFVHIPVIVTND